MHLFLTSVLPFLGHDHASAAAFLTCRHHNFHASIIPEFLSDEERVKSFCEARQLNQVEVDEEKQYIALYNLFVQTPLMQFSPSLIVFHNDCAESILQPLLETKYFTRTLKRCSVVAGVPLSNDLLQALSKVQSLAELDLGSSEVENEHLEIIINSFPSLEILTIQSTYFLGTELRVSSPPPPATKTLRSLKLRWCNALLATQLAASFFHLRKLVLCGQCSSSQPLDLLPLLSSLPLLTELDLENFYLKNTESLKNLVHLSALRCRCDVSDLSFLTHDSLPELTTLRINTCEGISTSEFASLSYAPNLHVLTLAHCDHFNNDCLQYLENMVHLRKLDLSYTQIAGDGGVFTQNFFHQLEELNLSSCRVGGQGAIAGALYSTHSRLRVLHLSYCDLADDDLNGIGVLKNTLEVLHLSENYELTNKSLVHCADLVKLKTLNLTQCDGIDDLSPLKDCLTLEDLDVSFCSSLTDDSFKIFSEEPNSFPNLRVLILFFCGKFTEKVFEHLSKNNHLVHRLKELDVEGRSEIVSSSSSARNNICQLKGLQRLKVCFSVDEPDQDKVEGELMRSLKNLEELK